jgi:uncharacterized protein YdeI (YjbR/CyaY-like superfamily)
MRPSGLAEIEAAQADGRWAAAYESQRTAEVPPDLAEALSATPAAGQAFAALNRSQQYVIILSLLTARTEATRAVALRRALHRLVP